MPVSGCSFCENAGDLSRVGAVIYEDERCALLLHEDWAVRGHAMLVWRRHVENVADLSEDEARHFAEIHRRAENALLAVTGAQRAILVKLGIQTPHLHLHIYPVRASLDRAAVMAVIDGRVKEPEDDLLIHELRKELRKQLRKGLTPPAQ